jgi:hypothetical protein
MTMKTVICNMPPFPEEFVAYLFKAEICGFPETLTVG